MTVTGPFTVTLHVGPPPLQPPPDHVQVVPAPLVAVAVSVTDVPLLKFWLHVPGQLIMPGLLVTFPVPVPDVVTFTVSGCAKVAVTVVLLAMFTVHVVPATLVQPLQLPKTEPAPAVGVRSTDALKLAVHVPGQLMPAGVLATESLAKPAMVTVSICPKVAVTVVLLVILTVHVVPTTLVHPLQPMKTEPPLAAGVRSTDVLKFAVQVAPQLMPAGLLVTVPLPVPTLFTVSVCPKVAVTVVLLVILTVHVVPATLVQPLQPINTEPALAAGVRSTDVLKFAVQVTPQLMPAGVLVTVPTPVPVLFTVSE